MQPIFTRRPAEMLSRGGMGAELVVDVGAGGFAVMIGTGIEGATRDQGATDPRQRTTHGEHRHGRHRGRHWHDGREGSRCRVTLEPTLEPRVRAEAEGMAYAGWRGASHVHTVSIFVDGRYCCLCISICGLHAALASIAARPLYPLPSPSQSLICSAPQRTPTALQTVPGISRSIPGLRTLDQRR